MTACRLQRYDVLVTQNGKHLEQTEDNSYEISMSPGINALEVFVTAQDGVTQSVYRFIVLHNTVSHIQVSGIQINGVALEGFDPQVHEYTYFAETADLDKVKIQVQSNGTTVIAANGQRTEGDTAEVGLIESNTDISVAVHAADGALTEYYVIHVQKPDDTNAKLEEVDAGKFAVLDKEFSPEENNYTGKVFAEEIRFTFTAEERNAVIHVKQNGEETASAARRLEQNLHFYKGENVVEVQV